ncbi:BlaI/MecI/CopY family transcriptional regulator [Intestinibacillus massiliensis]|uniref:BlaI/MecI/CopY family transcriptional regulator n=1 Tax=Intestinibacillus massiliensis TaxID=1871029 RepID=UPI000B34C9A3|nr:BlaI/MecI/CopY family transcriptional regulator [Intestinibacillus massiliensis]
MELTKSELELMEVLWQAGQPLSGSEIISNSKEKSWKNGSIHVLLNSLLNKQAIQQVGIVKSGKGYARTFEPTITSTEYYSEFLSKSAKRASVPLIVSALFRKNEITPQELDELERLLEEKRRELT